MSATGNAYASSLSIHRLALSVHLGVGGEERATPQAVEVDLTFYFPSPPAAGASDDADFLCYDVISGRIKAMCEGRPFRLIEYLGMEIYRLARATLSDRVAGQGNADDIKISLVLTKCHPPMEHVLGGTSYSYTDLPPFSCVPPQ